MTTPPNRVCPTCGSKVNENATRCLVCGRNLSQPAATGTPKAVQGPHIPEVTLSLPAAIGLLILVLAIGAGIVFAIMRTDKPVSVIVEKPTSTATLTATPTITVTPTASSTPSPIPTYTPLPPFEYIVKAGDFCSSIALSFNISIQSIVLLNNLPADCGTLSVSQKLKIPQPTPTASPMPTATLSSAQATEQACEKVNYTVKENDTLSTIARVHNVSMDTIKTYNGLTTDTVYLGMKLIIPLCKRLPTAGPTPTATQPPPYAAPNLLLPADGTSFMAANETITLQWAAVGNLRQNEQYAVTIEDITDISGKKNVEYAADTKFIVPSTLRPAAGNPHIFRWTVLAVRQTGTNKDGKPIWEPAGAVSIPRVFSWWSGTLVTPTP